GQAVNDNPLVDPVQSLSPTAKDALFNVARFGTLKRRTWHGCPLNRAGAYLDAVVVNEHHAMQVFDISRRAVRTFLRAWDYLPGTDEQCTELLADAIQTVGVSTLPPTRKPRWWRRQPVTLP